MVAAKVAAAANGNMRSVSQRRNEHRALRSSLRNIRENKEEKPAVDWPVGGSVGGRGGGRPDYARGISWAALIHMDWERKSKGAEDGHGSSSCRDAAGASTKRVHEDDDDDPLRRGDSRGTDVSSATPESNAGSRASHQNSPVSARSKSTLHSQHSRTSLGSRRSASSRKSASSKKSGRSGNTVTWNLDGSTMSPGSRMEPAHVKRQARERFERGVHYAMQGKYSAARERFLIALRYRVIMHRDRRDHPDVAAAHEMLGHVNHFLSRKADDEGSEEDLDVSRVLLDEGEGTANHGDSMLGWDVTIGGKTKKRPGLVCLEKAAMHYRTVLDMLGSNRPSPSEGSVRRVVSRRSALMDDDGGFRWAEISKAYAMDDGSSELGEESLMEIDGRVRERLDSLPVATTSGKSYARASLALST